ncbi:MAG: hypothetical protein IPJ06_11585 [Saprospiraceae bacterium]|nr:hypothetical protein [Saprospiraceae bacterium]
MQKRKRGLSIMILFLVLANIAGIVKIQLSADRLAQVYPILPADQVKWLTALPVITIVSLIAIWAGKRWGSYSLRLPLPWSCFWMLCTRCGRTPYWQLSDLSCSCFSAGNHASSLDWKGAAGIEM